jgi:hypothetical protein
MLHHLYQLHCILTAYKELPFVASNYIQEAAVVLEPIVSLSWQIKSWVVPHGIICVLTLVALIAVQICVTVYTIVV